MSRNTRPPVFRADVIVHAPLSRPLTRMEEVVCDLIGLRMEYHEIAEAIGISKSQVRDHCRAAAAKMPGDFPAQSRVMAWARGATVEVLRGDLLRLHVGLVARSAARSPHSGGNGVSTPIPTDSQVLNPGDV